MEDGNRNSVSVEERASAILEKRDAMSQRQGNVMFGDVSSPISPLRSN